MRAKKIPESYVACIRHSTFGNLMVLLKWGILGTSRIARTQVIPAMQASGTHRIVAVGSRDLARATEFASALNIPTAYGSYEELLEDPEVEAVYNPLPNHAHVRWSVKALEAGKHVLCEKPIALDAKSAKALAEAQRATGRVVAEAFMVRAHPQWLRVHELVRSSEIGRLALVTGHFSYSLKDPDNVRNKLEYGGGVLLDIGCYPIMLSRWLFGEEPTDVAAMIDRDALTGVDRLTSALLRFPSGQASFTCAGALVAAQSMQIYGEKARILVEIPFNPLPDRPARIIIDDGRDLAGSGRRIEEFPIVNQFALQADRFADAIRGVGDVPVSVHDAVRNMEVIDALFRKGV